MDIGTPEPSARAVGIDFQSSLKALKGKIIISPQVSRSMALDRECHGFRWIVIDGSPRERLRELRVQFTIRRPALADSQYMPVCAPRKGCGVAWIFFYCRVRTAFQHFRMTSVMRYAYPPEHARGSHKLCNPPGVLYASVSFRQNEAGGRWHVPLLRQTRSASEACVESSRLTDDARFLCRPPRPPTR